MNERDRIEYLMNLYGLTPSQFSDKTGIQRASVSHILSNRNKPSLDILLKIYHAFEGVELAWLVAGEGNPPKVNSRDVDIQESEDTNKVDGTPRATNMLFSFMEDDLKLKNDGSNVGSVSNTVANNVSEGVNVGVVAAKEERASATSGNMAKMVTSVCADADSDKRIKEIKVFYNNGTYETFLPEK
jgi:transcriptional regulator with XRE-family HTH domain